MGVDHALPVQEVALGAGDQVAIAALQGRQQRRVAGRGLGVRLELPLGLLQGARLATAPGLDQLLLLLLADAQQAEADQRAGQQQPAEGRQGAGNQRLLVIGDLARRLGRCGGDGLAGVLGGTF